MNEEHMPVAYAAYSLNEDERINSSSGGIFSLLSEHVLAIYGVIYGVAMNSDCRTAEFIRVKDAQGLEKLRGSKYLQAHLGKTFQSVKADLEEGLPVLFSGTGCQVNGLKGFLSKEYDTLYCVDMICHGTPSPDVWKEYVNHVEGKNRAKLVRVNFRCKKEGWSNYGIEKTDEFFRRTYSPKDNDPFMLMFLRNYCLRPSCYECIAKRKKLSDLTLGDFWGIDDVAPQMNDGKGVSLVLVRTIKGENLLAQIDQQMKKRLISYADGVRSNSPEYKSVERPAERETFFCDLKNMRFKQLVDKYIVPVPVSFKKRIKKYIKHILIRLGIFGQE